MAPRHVPEITAAAPSADTTLAELAVRFPAATRVFYAHGLDFCCRGRRPLAEACGEKGLDPAALLAAVVAGETTAADLTVWSEAPLAALVDHVTGHYHARLREEIPQLVAMAEKVERVHADKADCPHGLAAHLRQVHGAVLDHLEKEEVVLFPMILQGRGWQAAGPVQMMEHEHDDHGVSLARTRALTGDLEPPAEACTTWRALYLRLAELERELMEHIHLENNVLFPRALAA
jgi:regulator of cell morphogenesis and NO signaling